MWPEDVDLLHDIWLKLSRTESLGSRLHHRDVVGVALRRLQGQLGSEEHQGVIDAIRKELRKE
jgi:hypothetical protein